MSQSTAVTVTRPVTRPAPRPTARPGTRVPAPRLRVVSAPTHTRSRAGLVVASLAVLAVGLVGLLLLNVSLEKGAFVRRTQQSEIEQLSEQRQALQEALAARQAPQSLAAKAAALGMVEDPSVAFVRARDGGVLGQPSPGVAKRPATVTPRGSAAGGQPGTTGALTAGTTTASTKVTAAAKAAATTTATPSGKPAPSATGAKAPAPASATGKAATTRTPTRSGTAATRTAGATTAATTPATR